MFRVDDGNRRPVLYSLDDDPYRSLVHLHPLGCTFGGSSGIYAARQSKDLLCRSGSCNGLVFVDGMRGVNDLSGNRVNQDLGTAHL